MHAWKALEIAVATIAICAWAALAAAQNPELGDVGAGVSAEASTQDEASAEGAWTPTPAPATSDFDEEDEIADTGDLGGGSDHDGVVGRLGIGFFGVMEVPVMVCSDAPGGCSMPTAASVPAPTIGARYWLDAGYGVELGLGFNLSSPSAETDIVTGGMTARTVRTEDPSVLGLGLHGGVPLVFAHSGHFVFQVVPQLNFGFASGDHEVIAGGVPTTWDVSGFLLEVAAKAGAEIHFGFIDIPQLSLQATLGLAVRIENRSAENSSPTGTTTHDQSLTRIATGLDGEPWDIFTGSLTAIYYL